MLHIDTHQPLFGCPDYIFLCKPVTHLYFMVKLIHLPKLIAGLLKPTQRLEEIKQRDEEQRQRVAKSEA